MLRFGMEQRVSYCAADCWLKYDPARVDISGQTSVSQFTLDLLCQSHSNAAVGRKLCSLLLSQKDPVSTLSSVTIYPDWCFSGRAIPLRAWDRPWGFQGVKAPRLQGQSAHEVGKVVSYTHRPSLPSRKYSWYSCLRLSRPQGHSAAGRIVSMKNSNDTITNRTRDLPACSAVLQPTAPPRAPYVLVVSFYKLVHNPFQPRPLHLTFQLFPCRFIL